MPRGPSLALLAVGSFLVLLPLALGKPGLPPALKADEAAYYLMAESLVHDGDLRFDTRDNDRSFEVFHFRPARNLILMSDDGWRSAFYGKPLAYPLVAAPFVALFGANGMVALNALLLVALAGMGASYLARANEPWLATLFSCGFYLASTTFAYVFWLQPEVLSAFCVGSALFFGLPVQEHERSGALAPGGDRARFRDPSMPRLFASGALLAVAGYNKPMLLAVALPIVAAPLVRRLPWSGRVRPGLVWGAGCALSLVALAAVSNALIGHATPYIGPAARQGVTLCGPGELPPVLTSAAAPVATPAAPSTAADATDSAGGSDDAEPTAPAPRPGASAGGTNSFRWLIRVPEIHWGKLIENVGYFLWGRHTGLLPYFPFVGIALLLYLRFARTLERGLLLLALTAIALFLLVFIAWNWHGGGGFVGNRYYVSAVPGFLYLVGAIRPAWLAPLGFALSGLFLGPMLLTPFGAGVPEPTLQSHTRDFPLRTLPLELSLRNVPGYHTEMLGDLRIVARRDQVLPQGPSLLVAGAAPVEILVLTMEPLPEDFVVSVEAPAGGRLRIALGGDQEMLEMSPGETRQVALQPVRAGRRYSPSSLAWWVTELEVEAERGRLTPWTRTFPPPDCPSFAHNASIDDTFYTGAIVRLLGPSDLLERDLYRARWHAVQAPAHAAAGERFVVSAELENASDAPWLGYGSAQVHLSYRWLGRENRAAAAEGIRTALRSPLEPGERRAVEIPVEAPREPGSYTLALEPVLEFVSWFSDRDPASVHRVDIEVE